MKHLLAFSGSTVLLALSSVLHGGDYVRKGVLVPLSCAIMGALAWWVYGPWQSIAGALAALIWWFMARTGKQAHAELSYLDDVAEADLDDIWLAYVYYALVCGLLTVAGMALGDSPWVLLVIPAGMLMTVNTVFTAYWVKQTEWERRTKRLVTELVTPGVWACGAMSGFAMMIGAVSGWIG